jgi:hypothetical protein
MNDLGCSCIIDDDGGLYCDFYHETEAYEALKNYSCCECHETIPAGTPHEFVVGQWEGDWSWHHTCKTCVTIRNQYFCSSIFGRMREAIWDALHMDYITGEIDEYYDEDDDAV